MNRHNKIRDMVTAGVGAVLLVALLAVSASAVPDAGEAAAGSVTVRADACRLERVGVQYVRCDDLTGAGVAAPTWVPERADADADSKVSRASSGTTHAPRSLLR